MLGAPSLQDWQVPCCSFSTCDPEVAICRKQVQKGHYTDPRQAKNLCIKHCPSELCPMCATPTPSTGPHLSIPICLLHIYLSTKTNADYSQPSSLRILCLHSGISKAASNSWPSADSVSSPRTKVGILDQENKLVCLADGKGIRLYNIDCFFWGHAVTD